MMTRLMVARLLLVLMVTFAFAAMSCERQETTAQKPAQEIAYPVPAPYASPAPVPTTSAELPDMDELIPVDELPRMIESPKPVYPEAARQAGLEGTVFVKALINKEGVVQQAVVDGKRVGSNELEEAALQAVRQWKFQPAMKDSQAVAVWIVVPIKFKLDADKVK